MVILTPEAKQILLTIQNAFLDLKEGDVTKLDTANYEVTIKRRNHGAASDQ